MARFHYFSLNNWSHLIKFMFSAKKSIFVMALSLAAHSFHPPSWHESTHHSDNSTFFFSGNFCEINSNMRFYDERIINLFMKSLRGRFRRKLSRSSVIGCRSFFERTRVCEGKNTTNCTSAENCLFHRFLRHYAYFWGIPDERWL